MVHTADLELTAEELRVLGSLIEKERTTPDQYPLSTNALRTACNQKSSRDPVVDYDTAIVEAAMLGLRDKGYARSVTGSGRTVKHKQVIDEALGLSNAEVSVLGVLMLRGPQTASELRTRTNRLHDFDDSIAVEVTLDGMTVGDPVLVQCLPPAPGQRESRWIHLLADEAADQGSARYSPPAPIRNPLDDPAPEPAREQPQPTPDRGSDRPEPAPARHLKAVPSDPSNPHVSSSGSSAAARHSSGGRTDRARIAELEAEVASLRDDLTRLRSHFREIAEDLGYQLNPNFYPEE